MGVRTGVRCCGEVMAVGRESAISCSSNLLPDSSRHGQVAGCAIVDYMAGWHLSAVGRCFAARKFEDEVACLERIGISSNWTS
jgi:hypothetical protein